MPLELNDPSATFDVSHPSGAVFTLRHWTVGMQEEVEQRCVQITDGGKTMNYLTALDREMKIDKSVVSWSGVLLNGAEVPCNEATKKLLPVGVILWLQKEIEERAGLRLTPEEKKS